MIMLKRWWDIRRWELGFEEIDGVTWFQVGPFGVLVSEADE